MGKAKTAKTASKNNPTARQKAKDIMYKGKKVVPVQLITDKGRLMVAQFEDDSTIVKDENGHYVPWRRVNI